MDQNSLWSMVKANDVTTVQIILQRDSQDINLRGGPISPIAGRQINPTTPLQVAALAGHLEMASLLLRYGANVNVHSVYRNYTLLNHCVSHAFKHNRLESVPMIALLLQNRASTERKNTLGSTPLNTAAELCNFTEVTEILLQGGADVNTKNNLGFTPIMYCALKGDEAQFDMLMECGADIYMKNQDGHTAEDLARDHSYSESHRNIEAKLQIVKELGVVLQKCKMFEEMGLDHRSLVYGLPDTSVEKIVDEVYAEFLAAHPK